MHLNAALKGRSFSVVPSRREIFRCARNDKRDSDQKLCKRKSLALPSTLSRSAGPEALKKIERVRAEIDQLVPSQGVNQAKIRSLTIARPRIFTAYSEIPEE